MPARSHQTVELWDKSVTGILLWLFREIERGRSQGIDEISTSGLMDPLRPPIEEDSSSREIRVKGKEESSAIRGSGEVQVRVDMNPQYSTMDDETPGAFSILKVNGRHKRGSEDAIECKEAKRENAMGAVRCVHALDVFRAITPNSASFTSDSVNTFGSLEDRSTSGGRGDGLGIDVTSRSWMQSSPTFGDTRHVQMNGPR
ncbi:hypothetical protein CPB86DRAFT_829896 [Serendipita vermifera]|nr:hypothetical protein CPB86DRAFT_829896 [Serendipita vermifera]